MTWPQRSSASESGSKTERQNIQIHTHDHKVWGGSVRFYLMGTSDAKFTFTWCLHINVSYCSSV